MITGASYNVFNGEEHLLASLRSIRPAMDHINLVVQHISNVGLPARPQLQDVVQKAVAEKLADAVVWYEPDLHLAPVLNEHAKRNIGLQAARAVGVTHFMTMDCDEYYLREEVENAKVQIISNSLRATAVRTYLHIARPIYRSRLPDITCSAFLTAITDDSKIVLADSYPVPVDPTRRLRCGDAEVYVFPAETVSMRHMNLVRHDLSWKLANSTNAAAKEFMSEVAQVCSSWRPGDLLQFPGKPAMDIIQVDDIFGIDSEFRQNDSQWRSTSSEH